MLRGHCGSVILILFAYGRARGEAPLLGGQHLGVEYSSGDVNSEDATMQQTRATRWIRRESAGPSDEHDGTLASALELSNGEELPQRHNEAVVEHIELLPQLFQDGHFETPPDYAAIVAARAAQAAGQRRRRSDVMPPASPSSSGVAAELAHTNSLSSLQARQVPVQTQTQPLPVLQSQPEAARPPPRTAQPQGTHPEAPRLAPRQQATAVQPESQPEASRLTPRIVQPRSAILEPAARVMSGAPPTLAPKPYAVFPPKSQQAQQSAVASSPPVSATMQATQAPLSVASSRVPQVPGSSSGSGRLTPEDDDDEQQAPWPNNVPSTVQAKQEKAQDAAVAVPAAQRVAGNAKVPPQDVSMPAAVAPRNGVLPTRSASGGSGATQAKIPYVAPSVQTAAAPSSGSFSPQAQAASFPAQAGTVPKSEKIERQAQVAPQKVSTPAIPAQSDSGIHAQTSPIATAVVPPVSDVATYSTPATGTGQTGASPQALPHEAPAGSATAPAMATLPITRPMAPSNPDEIHAKQDSMHAELPKQVSKISDGAVSKTSTPRSSQDDSSIPDATNVPFAPAASSATVSTPATNIEQAGVTTADAVPMATDDEEAAATGLAANVGGGVPSVPLASAGVDNRNGKSEAAIPAADNIVAAAQNIVPPAPSEALAVAEAEAAIASRGFSAAEAAKIKATEAIEKTATNALRFVQRAAARAFQKDEVPPLGGIQHRPAPAPRSSGEALAEIQREPKKRRASQQQRLRETELEEAEESIDETEEPRSFQRKAGKGRELPAKELLSSPVTKDDGHDEPVTISSPAATVSERVHPSASDYVFKPIVPLTATGATAVRPMGTPSQSIRNTHNAAAPAQQWPVQTQAQIRNSMKSESKPQASITTPHVPTASTATGHPSRPSVPQEPTLPALAKQAGPAMPVPSAAHKGQVGSVMPVPSAARKGLNGQAALEKAAAGSSPKWGSLPSSGMIEIDGSLNRSKVTTCVITLGEVCDGASYTELTVAGLTDCRYQCLVKTAPVCTWAVYFGAETLTNSNCLGMANCRIYTQTVCTGARTDCTVSPSSEAVEAQNVYRIQKKEGSDYCGVDSGAV